MCKDDFLYEQQLAIFFTSSIPIFIVSRTKTFYNRYHAKTKQFFNLRPEKATYTNK